jgi:hypothetical protein
MVMMRVFIPRSSLTYLLSNYYFLLSVHPNSPPALFQSRQDSPNLCCLQTHDEAFIHHLLSNNIGIQRNLETMTSRLKNRKLGLGFLPHHIRR